MPDLGWYEIIGLFVVLVVAGIVITVYFSWDEWKKHQKEHEKELEERIKKLEEKETQ
jgi:uncharacterized membrane protein